ncbi:LysR family transcriptional regulator [Roseomonas sp. SSH11]|uniref:LysR family transcriptional regulator n=1 Tax=Pararoseomonas baculiformis TaxID=2820812 RepID=A0ABS4ALN3_9PROT|nr:LysR family transcriptional regulator [Pararoseomonas baculiformis]MBP0447799.1 LysR family transcriptional regulator [Pararoseomonas baculiformis]
MEPAGLLGDLAIFTRVVMARSVSAAALQLGAAKSSVSSRIAALERLVGARLLIRSRHGVQPTPAGERLAAAGRNLIADAEALLTEIRAGEDQITGTLRVTCAVGVADILLVPMLASFLRQHPALSVDVVATDLILDPRREGIDVSFRFGWLRRPEQGFVARRIGTYEGALVASPAYLATAGGEPTTPAALAQHTWIGSPAFGGMRQPLTLWDASGRRHKTVMTCRIRTTAPTQQREWVLSGLGITRLPRFFIADDLAKGALVRVLSDHRFEGPSLFAVYAREHAHSARVRALLTHIQRIGAEEKMARAAESLEATR